MRPTGCRRRAVGRRRGGAGRRAAGGAGRGRRQDRARGRRLALDGPDRVPAAARRLSRGAAPRRPRPRHRRRLARAGGDRLLRVVGLRAGRTSCAVADHRRPAAAAALAGEIAELPVRRSRGTSIARALAFATVLLEDDLVTAPRSIIDVSGDGANNTGAAGDRGARRRGRKRHHHQRVAGDGLPRRGAAGPRPLLRGVRGRRAGRLRDGRPRRRGAGRDDPAEAGHRGERRSRRRCGWCRRSSSRSTA